LRNQPIWVQFAIPKSAAPGDYEGYITIDNDAAPQGIAVHLHVYDFVLPDPRLLVTAWMNEVALAKHENVEIFSEPCWDLLHRTSARRRGGLGHWRHLRLGGCGGVRRSGLVGHWEGGVSWLLDFAGWRKEGAAVPKRGAELGPYAACVRQETYPNRTIDYPR